MTRLGASGTAVLLTQMRPPLESARGRAVEPYAQEVASIRDHLALVFHRFLEGSVPGRQKVTIRLHTSAGTTELRSNNPMGHPLTKPFDPRTIELQGHEIPSMRPTLTVQAFITPNEAEFSEYHKAQPPEEVREARDRLTLNGRANDSQGFYFYRLNRLIKWGGWEDLFAKDEHTKLLRVAVDFNRLAVRFVAHRQVAAGCFRALRKPGGHQPRLQPECVDVVQRGRNLSRRSFIAAMNVATSSASL